MPFIPCPSCHRSIHASEYFECLGADCSHFVQCPACDACFPLPGTAYAYPGVDVIDRQPTADGYTVEQYFAG